MGKLTEAPAAGMNEREDRRLRSLEDAVRAAETNLMFATFEQVPERWKELRQRQAIYRRKVEVAE